MFAWIEAEKAEFPISKLCQALQVSPSGFYAARGRPESAHAQPGSALARAGARVLRREPAAIRECEHARSH